MYKVVHQKGKFHIKDLTNNNESVAYSKSKKKAIQYSQNLLIQGFEGNIPGFFFAGNPVNLDMKIIKKDEYS